MRNLVKAGVTTGGVLIGVITILMAPAASASDWEVQAYAGISFIDITLPWAGEEGGLGARLRPLLGLAVSNPDDVRWWIGADSDVLSTDRTPSFTIATGLGYKIWSAGIGLEIRDYYGLDASWHVLTNVGASVDDFD